MFLEIGGLHIEPLRKSALAAFNVVAVESRISIRFGS